MEIATFQQYENGFYSFLFEDGIQIDFEEISPKALYKFDLKNKDSFIDESFKLTFSEVVDDKTGALIYRIDSLSIV